MDGSFSPQELANKLRREKLALRLKGLNIHAKAFLPQSLQRQLHTQETKPGVAAVQSIDTSSKTSEIEGVLPRQRIDSGADNNSDGSSGYASFAECPDASSSDSKSRKSSFVLLAESDSISTSPPVALSYKYSKSEFFHVYLALVKTGNLNRPSCLPPGFDDEKGIFLPDRWHAKKLKEDVRNGTKSITFPHCPKFKV